MLKRDLYYKLKKDFPHLKNETIKGALDVIFETMIEGLVDRRDIVLRNFGYIVTEERKIPISNFKTFSFGERKKETYTHIKYIPSPKLTRIKKQ
jgi:nucleoid DNA-binding protein